MLRIIFTSDYEIHGNGEGSPLKLMVQPTERMLELFDQFGARLTIMADVAEIQRFREYRDETGRDEFAFDAILAQLRRAVATRHDVQLHLHPSYYRAQWLKGRWEQDYASYDVARLGYARLSKIIGEGKAFLEENLRSSRPDYACTVFRAANWAMQPSRDIVRALIDNGIRIDTSVFKYGRREGLVQFDYTRAWSDFAPWPISESDVCEKDADGRLFEVPIYAERRWIGAFMSPLRLYRVYQSLVHRLSPHNSPRVRQGARSPWRSAMRPIRSLFTKHSWKLDFNQCTGQQLIGGMLRAESKSSQARCEVPLVLIGHSKLFTSTNARSLRGFLRFVQAHPDRFTFGRFDDVDLHEAHRTLSPGGTFAA